MLRRSSISIPRAMLHQHCQILSKSRTFSTIGDGEQIPPTVEKVVDKVVDKEKDPPPRMKKEPKKSSSKEDPKGVNKKQQLDILQQFYDASEAALRYAISTSINCMRHLHDGALISIRTDLNLIFPRRKKLSTTE